MAATGTGDAQLPSRRPLQQLAGTSGTATDKPVPTRSGQSLVLTDGSPHLMYLTAGPSLFQGERTRVQVVRDVISSDQVASLEVGLSESEVTTEPPGLADACFSVQGQRTPSGLGITVLVVDSQTLFRTGLARLLSEDSQITVIGVSEGGADLPELCAAMSIDVVLTDIQVKGWDGIELIRMISTVSPGTRVIVLAATADWRVTPAMSAGAAGFLLKDAEPESIRSAVISAHLGERVLSRQAAEWLMHDGPDYRLTRRERDLLALLAQGATNKEIADQLRLGDKTVRNYVSRLYRKLDVHDRSQISPRGSYTDLIDISDRSGVHRQDARGSGIQ
jgi:DNA-binding NarL/FixJ family response regulator